MRTIFVGLALHYLLAAEVDSRGIPNLTPTVPALPTQPTPVSPTDANTTDDDTNSTVAVIQVTDYHYFDWPRIGYQIFMQKMSDALQTLKLFMSLDPTVLKITRTYILTNDTDLDYDDNNSTNTNSDEIYSTDANSNEIYSTPADQPTETNTESPLILQVVGDSDDYSGQDKSSSNENLKSNSEASKQNDVVKSKTETGGFFSSIVNAVASFYHDITGWF